MPLLRNILLHFLYPLTLLLLLVLAGLCFRGARRRLLGTALVFFLLISYPLVPNLLLHRLTRAHPPMTEMPAGVGDIVVLAANTISIDPEQPLSIRLSAEHGARLTEGVRLARRLPEARLWISISGNHIEEAYCQSVLAELSALFALDPERLRALPGAGTTRDEARITAEHLEGVPLILVTSDYHMPRALQAFRRAGLEAHPAPVRGEQGGGPRSFALFPSARNIENLRLALHEHLGLLAGSWGE